MSRASGDAGRPRRGAPPQRSSLRGALLLSITVSIAGACHAGRSPYPLPAAPPNVVHLAGGGVVRGHGPEESFQVAQLIGVYDDVVRQRIGYRRSAPLEVWCVPGWPVKGTTFEECVIVRPLYREAQAMVLVHELVHWHAYGTPIQEHLPHTVQEGLCTWAAVTIVPGWWRYQNALARGVLAQAQHEGRLPALIARLGLPVEEWAVLPGEESLELYALGFALVRHVGAEALLRAAERGPLSPAEVLRMAGVGPGGGGLLRGPMAAEAYERELRTSLDQVEAILVPGAPCVRVCATVFVHHADEPEPHLETWEWCVCDEKDLQHVRGVLELAAAFGVTVVDGPTVCGPCSKG